MCIYIYITIGITIRLYRLNLVRAAARPIPNKLWTHPAGHPQWQATVL